MTSVIDLANQFKRDLANSNAQSIEQIINSYRNIYQSLKVSIDELSREIGSGFVTRGRLYRLERFKNLMSQVERELDSFEIQLKSVVGQSATINIAAGQEHARQLVLAPFESDPRKYAEILARFEVLPTGAIENLTAFFTRTGPLMKVLNSFGQFRAQAIRAAIVEGVGLGSNSKKIARMIRDELGLGLNDALRITRTAQNYAYRISSHQTYEENSFVTGWIWYSALDTRTCMGCIALHGTLHPKSEQLNDHHMGRCAPLPVVEGADLNVRPGEDWFRDQEASVQMKMMGIEKTALWREGKLKFDMLITSYRNEVYGTMRREATLKEILRRIHK